MSPSATEKFQAKYNPSDVEGQHNEWKFRAPYKVRSKEESFNALYEGSCHCGRVKYQLSREKPLEAKYCHCRTCQVLHGSCISPFHFHFHLPSPFLFCSPRFWSWGRSCFDNENRSTLPVGSNLPQRRHQLHARASPSRLVRKQRENDSSQTTM